MISPRCLWCKTVVGNSLIPMMVLENIITVPMTVLKAGDITFRPALPQEQTEAWQRIGMGPGMKVFLKFRERFYPGGVIGGKTCALYTDESAGKKGKDHVLLAFLMGDQAAAMSALASDDAITQALLQDLDEIYAGKASANFLASRVIDWTNRPHIRGAYSFLPVGAGKRVREIASRPVANRIFFAGEAMNRNGHPSTVHGAMETGIDAVEALLANP